MFIRCGEITWRDVYTVLLYCTWPPNTGDLWILFSVSPTNPGFRRFHCITIQFSLNNCIKTSSFPLRFQQIVCWDFGGLTAETALGPCDRIYFYSGLILIYLIGPYLGGHYCGRPFLLAALIMGAREPSAQIRAAHTFQIKQKINWVK